jgi:CBS domain-containing protein
MVTTLEDRHAGLIQRKMQEMSDDIITESSFEVFVGRNTITLSSIMTRDVITMDHTKTAHDAATFMKEKGIGSIIINAYGRPFGIVTERDLRRIMATLSISAKSLILSFLASRPLIYASPTQTIQEASEIMVRHNIDHLPIMEKEKIVGMISTRDLAMSLLYA